MSSSGGSQPLTHQYLEAYIGYEVVTAAVVFIVLDIICVALRILSRHLSKARPGLDDYLVIPSLIFCVAVCAICICKLINDEIDNPRRPKSFRSCK